MVRTFMFGAACAAVLTVSPTAFAQGQFGTADEAKAMLVRAAAAVKSDKTKTLELINKGEGGFLDRDLYPFCFENPSGVVAPRTPATFRPCAGLFDHPVGTGNQSYR